jgi:hypothetical protein
MNPATSFVATSKIASSSSRAPPLPRECTFPESDWRVLAAFWYPVAFSYEVNEKPHAVRLLDERVVVYRLSDGSVAAARDICYHRGVPLSLGYVEGDEIICKYHGLHWDHVYSNQAFTHKLNEYGIVHEAEEYSGTWSKEANWGADGRVALDVPPVFSTASRLLKARPDRSPRIKSSP